MGAPLHDITVCKSNQKIKFYITKILKGILKDGIMGMNIPKGTKKNIKCRKCSNSHRNKVTGPNVKQIQRIVVTSVATNLTLK